jgi:hypothetical protein
VDEYEARSHQKMVSKAMHGARHSSVLTAAAGPPFIQRFPKWWDQYGIHPIAVLEYIAKYWILTLVVGVLGVLGITITSYFS